MNQDNEFKIEGTNVTVSMTSYPERVQFVPQTIKSINCQSIPPARVVLYLAAEEFINGEDDLPDALLEQAKDGQVEIHWCDLDLKPHKKYFYAIQEYPDDVIITVDDDEIYPNTMIEELLLSWLKFPNAISARRVHLITTDQNGKIRPYLDWIHSYNGCVQEPSMQLIGVGGAGTLYPPHLLPQAVFDADAIIENALYTDDLWIKAFTTIYEIPVVLAVKNDKTQHIKGTQKTALYYHNKFVGGNDESLRKINTYIDCLYDSHDLFPTTLLSSHIGTRLSEDTVLGKHNQLCRGFLHIYRKFQNVRCIFYKGREKKFDKYSKLVIFSQGYEGKYPLEIERLNNIDGVYAGDDFRHHKLILRIIRRIHILSKLPGIGIWLGRWRKFLPECDTLICMTHPYSPYILCWVKKHYPNIKCINYFWDEVDVSGYPIIKTEDFENWSFCRWDCQKYGFHYNPQFYVNSIHLPDVPIAYDIVFVGADRNGQSKYRANELNKCMKLFKKENLTSFIWFVSDNPDIPENIRRKRRLNEDEYLLATAKANAVLDLVDPRKPWMTMRPLLALTNGKKVITNSRSIQQERFYSKANVFILGYDSDDKLSDFIHTPFENIPEDILYYYEASEWIKRFER